MKNFYNVILIAAALIIAVAVAVIRADRKEAKR